MSTQITYELAFALKEAGFPNPEEPLTGHYDSWTLRETDGLAYSEKNIIKLFPGYTYQRHFIYIPTLSELIEAIKDKQGFSLWWVKPRKKWGSQKIFYLEDKVKGSYGFTPEEAVAKLWLKLQDNKKAEEIK